MSQQNPLQSIDLSGLPEVLRKKVQEQLARMTPEMQQEFLKKSRPMLNRAMETAKDTESKGIEAVRQINRMKPQGHYNATIQPGDEGSNMLFKLGLLIVVGVLVYDLLT